MPSYQGIATIYNTNVWLFDYGYLFPNNFFMSWKTKMNIKKKKKKSFQEVELYVPEANTPVYLFHLCLTSAIKPPSRCLGLLYLAFLYRAACDSSLFQTETEYRM